MCNFVTYMYNFVTHMFIGNYSYNLPPMYVQHIAHFTISQKVWVIHMEVWKNGGYPRIIDSKKIFHYEPTIWGSSIYRNHHIVFMSGYGLKMTKWVLNPQVD